MAGKACDYQDAWLFEVEVPGFTRAKFKKVTGIEVSVNVRKIREGGALLEEKHPTFGNVEDVEFERGITSSTDYIDWFNEVADFINDEGADVCDDFKRDIVVKQLNRRKDVVRRRTLVGAFPNKLKEGDFDSDSEDVLMETMTVSYDYPIPG